METGKELREWKRKLSERSDQVEGSENFCKMNRKNLCKSFLLNKFAD